MNRIYFGFTTVWRAISIIFIKRKQTVGPLCPYLRLHLAFGLLSAHERFVEFIIVIAVE